MGVYNQGWRLHGKTRLRCLNGGTLTIGRKFIKFPNLDDYDWEGSSKRLKEVTEAGRAVSVWVMNGIFERLISFMEFENAALALIDEDQKDAVHALFSRLCDFYDDMFKRFKKYYNADGIYFS